MKIKNFNYINQIKIVYNYDFKKIIRRGRKSCLLLIVYKFNIVLFFKTDFFFDIGTYHGEQVYTYIYICICIYTHIHKKFALLINYKFLCFTFSAT